MRNRRRDMLQGLPSDAVMLLSVINTKLRDHYSNLQELCEDLDISRKELEEKLDVIDYSYDEELNQFV